MLQNKLQMVTFTYKNCSTSCSAGAKSSSVCYNNIIFLVFAEPLGNTTIRQMPFSFPNHECWNTEVKILHYNYIHYTSTSGGITINNLKSSSQSSAVAMRIKHLSIIDCGESPLTEYGIHTYSILNNMRAQVLEWKKKKYKHNLVTNYNTNTWGNNTLGWPKKLHPIFFAITLSTLNQF